METLNHQHLIVRGYVKFPPYDEETCNAFLEKLVYKLDMNFFFPPKSRYSEVEGNRGVTGIVGLTTSHASIHIWDEPQYADPKDKDTSLLQLDIYSCRSFSYDKVIELLKNSFGLTNNYSAIAIDRNMEILVPKIVQIYPKP